MSRFVEVRPAGPRETGVACACCRAAIVTNSEICACPDCGAVEHADCYEKSGCCGWDCSPKSKTVEELGQPTLKISLEEVSRAAPLPRVAIGNNTRSAQPPGPLRNPRDNKTDRWALASLITAIAGIPLFGLVTGLVAVVLGLIALTGLQNTRRKGTGAAVVGMVLGFTDVAVWGMGLWLYFNGGLGAIGGHGGVEMPLDSDPDVATIEKLPEHLRRGMLANVFIEGQSGLFLKMIGSGVIVKTDETETLIATNRHVVDQNFEENSKDGKLPTQSLRVRILGQPVQTGRVIWIAPDGIDLALMSVPLVAKNLVAAVWKAGAPCQVGDNVFVIGNPQGLGWSNTSGQISQIRQQRYGFHNVRVLQTSAAINHGNSGGGLYSADGQLLGIPTWTQDKRVAEGLNFAIGFETLLELYPKLATPVAAEPAVPKADAPVE